MPLPTFKGLTVDYRLRQFRRVPTDFGPIDFIPFDSDEGDTILAEMIREGKADWSKLHL